MDPTKLHVCFAAALAKLTNILASCHAAWPFLFAVNIYNKPFIFLELPTYLTN